MLFEKREIMSTIKRPEGMKRINTAALANAFIDEQIDLLKRQIGDRKVIEPEIKFNNC